MTTPTQNVPAQWQLCPKCNGQGQVEKPPYLAAEVIHWSSTQASFVCDVCNGAKIIAPPASSALRDALEKIAGIISDGGYNTPFDKIPEDIQKDFKEWVGEYKQQEWLGEDGWKKAWFNYDREYIEQFARAALSSDPGGEDEKAICSHCGDEIEHPLCRNCDIQLTLPTEEY